MICAAVVELHQEIAKLQDWLRSANRRSDHFENQAAGLQRTIDGGKQYTKLLADEKERLRQRVVEVEEVRQDVVEMTRQAVEEDTKARQLVCEQEVKIRELNEECDRLRRFIEDPTLHGPVP